MAASLRLLDDAGAPVSLDASAPLEFGTVDAGATTGATRLQVENDGDETLYFVTVRALAHPTGQVGAGEHTHAATEVASSETGNFVEELELGTLAPGAEASAWVRWVVPASAPAGAVVWAVEAIGSET